MASLPQHCAVFTGYICWGGNSHGRMLDDDERCTVVVKGMFTGGRHDPTTEGLSLIQQHSVDSNSSSDGSCISQEQRTWLDASSSSKFQRSSPGNILLINIFFQHHCCSRVIADHRYSAREKTIFLMGNALQSQYCTAK